MKIALLCLALFPFHANAGVAGTKSVMRSKSATMARHGTVQHIGPIASSATHEGNGSASTRREAIRNSCYADSGMRVVSRSVRRGANGQWYATTAYRSR